MPFGDQFEKAVWNFNKTAGKRMASEIGSAAYRMLSKGTEVFFRRDMGERHFSPESIANGFMLWGITAVASCFTGTMISPILRGLSLDRLAGFFYGAVWPSIMGCIVIFFYWRFAIENTQRMGEFRSEGKTYHSKSRGVPRWEPSQDLAIRVGAILVLLAFAPIMGLAFIASIYVSANLAAQQQAALYDRYLDMLDAQIEGELLQDALLGKCPPEITYLYKPLPDSLKPELRENIAAAAVGKPVKIVAQAPRPLAGEPVTAP
jgi:hypothetical protein